MLSKRLGVLVTMRELTVFSSKLELHDEACIWALRRLGQKAGEWNSLPRQTLGWALWSKRESRRGFRATWERDHPYRGSHRFRPSSWHWILGPYSKLHNRWEYETVTLVRLKGEEEQMRKCRSHYCTEHVMVIGTCVNVRYEGKHMGKKTRRGSKYEKSGTSHTKHLNRTSYALAAFQQASRPWRPKYPGSVGRLPVRCLSSQPIRPMFVPRFSRFHPQTSSPVG